MQRLRCLFPCCFFDESDESQALLILGQGLPNVGLNCHLNTVIQLLYSMDNMREYILKVGAKNQGSKFTIVVADVFKAMNANAELKEKTNAIKKLGQAITSERDDFKLNKYNDVTNVLTIILQRLIDEDEKNIKKYIEVLWQKACKCQKIQIREIISKTLQICADCKESMKAEMIDSPLYLIAFNNDKEVSSRLKFPKNSSFQTYQLISMSEFTGNHYLCYRYDGNDMYRFNDDKVSLFRDNINKIRSSKIVIYKKLDERSSVLKAR